MAADTFPVEDVIKENTELTEQFTGTLLSHHLCQPMDFAFSAGIVESAFLPWIIFYTVEDIPRSLSLSGSKSLEAASG